MDPKAKRAYDDKRREEAEAREQEESRAKVDMWRRNDMSIERSLEV